MTIQKTTSVLAVGDIILDAPDPGQYFPAAIRDVLKTGDVVVGQIEVPHTLRGLWSNPEASSAPPADPDHLKILPELGFNVATLAGNHIFDQGVYGITDTRDQLLELGLATTGAGVNLDEAKKPAIIERDGRRFAFLSYNAVGPAASWATPLKPGGAFIKVSTHYESDKAEPGGSPTNIYTIADPACVAAMERDIRQAAQDADFVICAFHMGRMFSTDILQYQTEVNHRAIDAGASATLCCHAHNLLGIEVYKGRPIYHGLGHFVTVTEVAKPDCWARPQHSFQPFSHPGTTPYWALPVGDYSGRTEYYMFNEESRQTLVATLRFGPSGLVSAGFIPCLIVGGGAVVPLTRSEGGEQLLDYMRGLCRKGGLTTEFRWSEDGSAVDINL
jgi:hypothetical protein